MNSYPYRFSAQSLEADMRRSRDVAAADRDRLAAEVATLTAECERLRGDAPRFAVGDRVTVDGLPGVLTVVHRAYGVRYKDGDVRPVGERYLQPAPDAKPAEPVWHPCSAAEAREKHAAGMRVRKSGQPDEWAQDLWLHRGKPSRQATRAAFAAELLSELALSDYTSGWSWSDPLPETEGGAK